MGAKAKGDVYQNIRHGASLEPPSDPRWRADGIRNPRSLAGR